MSDALVAVFSGGGTGGHLYPALALARSLSDRRPDVRPFFVGAERGLEARVLPERGLRHLLLPVEGFQRGRMLANLRVVTVLFRALGRVAELFRRLRPSLVVVTGGYAGGPAGLVAVLTRTRLVLQEQNSVPGVTTRMLAFFADEVHVAFPEAIAALPRRARPRARVSGNPVEPPEVRPREEAAASFGVNPDGTVVLVVGGSQGAFALNQALLGALAAVERGELGRPVGLQLLWATGPTHLAGVRRAVEELGGPEWVHSIGYIDRMNLALSLADLAVSRAGAMATSEFLAWGVPAVLVPLPSAAANHQARNAQALEDAGAAIHLPEGEATPRGLWERISRLALDPVVRQAMASAARSRGRPHAALEIAAALDAQLPPPPFGKSGSRGSRERRG